MRVHQYPLPFVALLAFALVPSLDVPADTTVPPSYLATIHSIDHERAPYIENRLVVFTYEPRESTRFVALRFEHEHYAVVHPYAVNANDIFVLFYGPPEGLDRLVYRMSVDGLWMHDPSNPASITDVEGRRYSVVDLAGHGPAPVRNPTVEGNDVRLVYTGRPGMRVSVSGSFNGWDPFADYLTETAPGVYSIHLRLAEGQYYYFFFADGRRVIDPYNSEHRRNPEDLTVSYFSVGG